MIINACGRICSECTSYKIDCQGCYPHRETAPNKVEEGMCPIYQCAMEKFTHRSCSECKELPCERYSWCIDNELTKQENIDDIKMRVQRLRLLLSSSATGNKPL